MNVFPDPVDVSFKSRGVVQSKTPISLPSASRVNRISLHNIASPPFDRRDDLKS